MELGDLGEAQQTGHQIQQQQQQQHDHMPLIPEGGNLPIPGTIPMTLEDKIGELSALLEDMGNNVSLSKHDDIAPQVEDSIYTTVHNWSSHRQSNSLPRVQTNIRERNNPSRANNSLTHRDRDYIYRTEENEPESRLVTDFDRKYGHTWKDHGSNRNTVLNPSSSTPYRRGLMQLDSPHSYLNKRLGTDTKSSPIVRRKTVRSSHIQ